MKQLWKFIVNKLKNEPVLLVAFIAIVAQAGQKALDTGHFTFQIWMIYIFQASMAFVMRGLVSPASKLVAVENHRDMLAADLNGARKVLEEYGNEKLGIKNQRGE